jgi:hypothetical protein
MEGGMKKMWVWHEGLNEPVKVEIVVDNDYAPAVGIKWEDHDATIMRDCVYRTKKECYTGWLELIAEVGDDTGSIASLKHFHKRRQHG